MEYYLIAFILLQWAIMLYTSRLLKRFAGLAIIGFLRECPASSGHRISTNLNMNSALMYPLLAKLEHCNIIKGEFEEGEYPRRKLYWINK